MNVIPYTLSNGTVQYRVKFLFRGMWVQKKGFRSRQAAQRWEVDERRRLENPEAPATPKISFGALTNRYLDSCRTRMQLNTIRAKYKYYCDFLAFLQEPLQAMEDGAKPDPPAEDVTHLQVLDYLEGLQRREGSKRANRDLKDLLALYNWANKYRIIQENPFRGIEPFPEDPAIKYIPPPEDIDAVLIAAEPEETDMLTVLYHTGGRIGEIRRLTWEDVNFEKRSITLWTRKRHGGQLEEDKLSMGDSLHKMLMHRWKRRNKESAYVFCRKDGSPHTKDGQLRHLMEDLCARAQVRPFGFHAIRHHVASMLADSGKATLGQIQKFLRHRRPTTTEKYLHEVTRDQVEVAQILNERQDLKVPNRVPNYQLSVSDEVRF